MFNRNGLKSTLDIFDEQTAPIYVESYVGTIYIIGTEHIEFYITHFNGTHEIET